MADKWDADYADFIMIYDDWLNFPKRKTSESFPPIHLVVGCDRAILCFPKVTLKLSLIY